MTFVARDSVRNGLDHLAVRLDSIIAERLAADLNGLPWPVVLTELDRARGRAPRECNAKDVQCQLRMLSERLGNLGYPFDDHARVVSTLASELRIVRNAEKHYDDVTAMDAWRAHDTCVRLLTRLDDSEGADCAATHREEAIAAVVAESGTFSSTEEAAGRFTSSLSEDAEPTEGELVEPSSEVLVRTQDVDTPTIGDARAVFEPWQVVVVGAPEMLDHVARRANKDKLRATATEIVEFEGPIHLQRLIQLVTASFAVPRLTMKRWNKVERQVRQLGLHLDGDWFLWPSDLDPAGWTEFRPNDSTANRDFLHISPVEVANARRFLAEGAGDLTKDQLDAATLQTFGRKRRTKAFAAHLARSAAVGVPEPV